MGRGRAPRGARLSAARCAGAFTARGARCAGELARGAVRERANPSDAISERTGACDTRTRRRGRGGRAFGARSRRAGAVLGRGARCAGAVRGRARSTRASAQYAGERAVHGRACGARTRAARCGEARGAVRGARASVRCTVVRCVGVRAEQCEGFGALRWLGERCARERALCRRARTARARVWAFARCVGARAVRGR